MTHNERNELLKLFEFNTLSANSIRTDLMYYVIENVDRKQGIEMLIKYVPVHIAHIIENGILEYVMLKMNVELSDVMENIIYYYIEKVRDICVNLDMKNTRICNKTLLPDLLNGYVKPEFVAFMSPQQIHPLRWKNELDKISFIEKASDSKKVTDLYKCSRCGDRKCTTVQMQTRGADEPMSIIITCMTCFKTFKTC